jgi:hypothetical protein
MISNLSAYSTLLVVAECEDQFSHILVPIKQADKVKINQRDLSLVKPMDSEKCFSEVRQVQQTIKGGSLIIEDITSTQMQFVDSMEKIWRIQKDLYRGSLDVSQQDMINTILKWTKLNKDQKEKAYSDFCSHEFNTFLKLKDPEFF